MPNSLICEMTTDCLAKVTHIDESGYIYCTTHGWERQTYCRCRSLTGAEIRKLERGEALRDYDEPDNNEPDNEDRAAWAAIALDAFGAATGQRDYDYGDSDSLIEIAGDLICNLLHLGALIGLEPDALIGQAQGHFGYEIAEAARAEADGDAPEWACSPIGDYGAADPGVGALVTMTADERRAYVAAAREATQR
jgi:hypothetical protein